ncbi:MmgE/PrpD family protein [Lutimaribacter marinistellae]|uniref:MmgE/PrpD family protein n=1 Tax=Lutimaribacter marinistellae TaxID=1820329 RepID=A0ABV7TK66_9RHOB
MTAIERLARFVTTAAPDPGLVTVIAPAIADCFGCILAGASSDVAERVAAASAVFGPGPAPRFGTDMGMPIPLAAQLNAVAGHAWDLDDWEEPANTHPTVVLLPALLAAAALRKTSGAELMAAYAVGAEIIMRLGEAVTLDHYSRGFHSTATLGTIGVAGAAARLMRLSAGQTAQAIALSVSQASGYTLQFGSHAKPLQAGWAARNGLEAALLAAQGVTGQSHVLDHPRGFAGLMGTFDPDRFALILNKLGQPWALREYGLVLKPWPSCGYTHRLMTAALSLRPKVASRLPEIAAIHASLPDFHAEILPFHRPASRGEALFSIPACVAQTLTAGTLTLTDSANGFWERPAVAALIEVTRVSPEPARRPDLNYDPNQPDRLRIAFGDGDVIAASCAYPLGAAQQPMTAAQLAAKYSDITAQPETAFRDLLGWQAADDISAFFKEHSHAAA